MKKLMPYLFLLLLTTTYMNGFGQSRDYPIITQNDKQFYLYEVKSSEGLYRISKNFKVSQEEILKYNQHAVAGISKGMKLIIPVIEVKTTTALISTTPNTPQYGTHIVQSGETLYGIAREYKVKVDDIRSCNEGISEGIKVGMELKIPQKESKESKNNTYKAQSEKTVLSKISSQTKEHIIAPKETLYSLSKTYNISINDLINLNPELTHGLQIGQVIKVPDNSNVSTKAINTSESKPSGIKKPEYTAAPTHVGHSYNHIIKVALLLPFMLNNPEKQDATIDKFIEFYEGALLAVEKLKKNGVSIQLITYDIEKSETKVKEVLQSNIAILKKVDLIIGPAYSSQVKLVSTFAQTHSIPLVVPFSPSIPNIASNPYIFQNNAPHQKQFNEASNVFMQNFFDKNIVIIHFNNDTEDVGSEFSRFLINRLKKENIAYKELHFTQEEYAGINKLLVQGKENILVYATDKPYLIKDLLPKIAHLNTPTTPISVFGFSNWDKALKIHPSTYYYTAFFVDRKNKEIGIYRNKFRQEFGHTTTTGSPKFDFMGYDLTYYFINAISIYGKSFFSYLHEYEQTQTLQSRFQFVREDKGGFINNWVRLVRYTPEHDFEVVE
ncbi:MAG: LysM peptidoglycan-binding domain-containing protein [Paludibacteraceae bacterium]|nr:LysM peptidoglycan-binding domain-containing protein [Paludibacteraceae bacterium]